MGLGRTHPRSADPKRRLSRRREDPRSSPLQTSTLPPDRIDWRASSLPPVTTTNIKTEWVQSIGASMAASPVLYSKDGMLSDLARSRIVDVERRLSGTQTGKFVKFPRMSTITGRLIDSESSPDLSYRKLDERRQVDRTVLPYNYTEQHHTIGKIPPLELHVVRRDEDLGSTYTYPHDPSLRDPSSPLARTRQGRESRVAIPLEQGGVFVCEVDRSVMDGSLNSCVAGQTYSIGVSLRYGYGASKTGTDVDRQMLEDWMYRTGGLSAYLTGPADIPCNCTHVAEGSYAFVFSANILGEYQLWIFAGRNPVPGCPMRVMINAGEPYAKGCTISGLGLWSSHAGHEATFDWVARDKHGNSVMRGGHPFTVTMYGPEEIVINIKDYGDGNYTAVYTASIAGQHRISVQLNGEHLPGSPFLVNVKEDAGDPNMSTVSGEGLEDCEVGGDRHFLVEAVDRFGNRVLHGGNAFAAELRGPVPEKVHLIDMDDGTYAGSYMCRWSGTFALYITLDGTAVAKSPYMIKVRPGATLAQNCECTLVKMPMSRLVCQAGTSCSFVIFAKDRYGNQRDEGGDEFTVKCRGPTDTVGAVIKDNKDGTYLAEFVCVSQGEYFIDVKLQRIDIIHSPFSLTVDPAKTEPRFCVAEGVEQEWGNGLKGGGAGRPLVFIIQARDKFGNRVFSSGEDFQVKITEVIEKIRVRAKVVDQGDGTYEVTWVGMIRGEYDIEVTLHDEVIQGSPWKAVITTGSPSAPKCTAEGTGLGGAYSGVPASILMEANDHYGNVVTRGGANVEAVCVSVDGKYSQAATVEDHSDGTYTITYTAYISTDYFLAVRVDGEHIHESPFLVFVDHTDSDPAYCHADGRHAGGDGLKACMVGTESGFVVTCSDRFGNKATVGGDDIKAELRGEKNVAVEVLDHQDGHYTCTYTAIWAGLYRLHVMLNQDEIAGSPFTVVAESAGLHPASCYVHGSGVYACIAGVEAEFHVQAKDMYDNLRPEEDGIEVKISGPESVPIMRQYLGDGQYDFSWTANTAGQYEVDVVYQKQSIATAPYTVTVGPGLVYPINCVAQGTGVKRGEAGELHAFVIQARDKYGNDRLNGGDRFVVSITGPSTCEAKIKDMENGKYNVTWNAVIKGTYWIQITLNGEEISGSPYFCEIFPGPVDVAKSTAEGMALLAIATYRDSTFTIHSHDKYGNHLDMGGDPWEVSVVGTEIPKDIRIDDNQDGTYTVCYQSTMKGNLQVYIGIRGRELPECPFEVISDVKVRRRDAQKKLEERNAAKLQKEKNRQARKSSVLVIDNDDDEAEEKAGKSAVPKRGTSMFDPLGLG